MPTPILSASLVDTDPCQSPSRDTLLASTIAGRRGRKRGAESLDASSPARVHPMVLRQRKTNTDYGLSYTASHLKGSSSRSPSGGPSDGALNQGAPLIDVPQDLTGPPPSSTISATPSMSTSIPPKTDTSIAALLANDSPVTKRPRSDATQLPGMALFSIKSSLVATTIDGRSMKGHIPEVRRPRQRKKTRTLRRRALPSRAGYYPGSSTRLMPGEMVLEPMYSNSLLPPIPSQDQPSVTPDIKMGDPNENQGPYPEVECEPLASSSLATEGAPSISGLVVPRPALSAIETNIRDGPTQDTIEQFDPESFFLSLALWPYATVNPQATYLMPP